MPLMEKAFEKPLLADFTAPGLVDEEDGDGDGDLMSDDSGGS